MTNIYPNSTILSSRSNYFCDDLQNNVSIHYNYDGTPYNCFKLWSDSRFSLNDIYSKNEILQLVNNKNNFTKCSSCWAKYLCELCVVDTFLGKEDFPFLKNVCEREKRFDYALEKILEKVVTGEINKIRDNFINYI